MWCRDTAHFDRFHIVTFAVIPAINACGRAKIRGGRHSWLRWGWHGQFPLLTRWRGSTGVLRWPVHPLDDVQARQRRSWSSCFLTDLGTPLSSALLRGSGWPILGSSSSEISLKISCREPNSSDSLSKSKISQISMDLIASQDVVGFDDDFAKRGKLAISVFCVNSTISSSSFSESSIPIFDQKRPSVLTVLHLAKPFSPLSHGWKLS